MEKETIEEVAHKILVEYGVKSMGQSLGVLEVKKLMVDIAKWQQEQDKNKYSEEEVIDLLYKKSIYQDHFESDAELREWFEQFKKK